MLERVYYQTKKEKGLTAGDVAAELGVSVRTAERLAHSWKRNFFEAELEHEVPRRVEFLLWSEPRSQARLLQLLHGVTAEQLEEALANLVGDGRVIHMPGRTPKYRGTRRANRLPDDTQAAKVDALNNMLETMRETVARRFFGKDADAGARTLGLRIRKADIRAIETFYEDKLWPHILELEDQARDCKEEEIAELGVVLLWSPLDGEPTQGDGT